MGPCLSAFCASGTANRVPARGAALVGLLAQRRRHWRDGRTDAASLDDRKREARAAPRPPAGAVGGRAFVAVTRNQTVAIVLDRRRTTRGERIFDPSRGVLATNGWEMCGRLGSFRSRT